MTSFPVQQLLRRLVLSPGFVCRLGRKSITLSLAEVSKASAPFRSPPTPSSKLRILEARPLYGTDIRNTETAKDLPQETNPASRPPLRQRLLPRPGDRRAHPLPVARCTASSPRSDSKARLPSPFPASLEANGKPAGELTSAVAVPTTEGERWLALGYARREFLESGAPLTYANRNSYPPLSR